MKTPLLRHSPPPWHLSTDNEHDPPRGIFDDDTKEIAAVFDTEEGVEGDDPTADANWVLIAAAPSLLAAAIEFRAAVVAGCGGALKARKFKRYQKAAADLDAAISQATDAKAVPQ